MGENRPSDVFFALWYYRARGGPSITQEDFKVCAEAWRELRNREDGVENYFIQPGVLPLSEILRCAQDGGAAEGAEGPGDPSAAPRDDSNKAPRDDMEEAPSDDGNKAPTLSGPWSSYKNEIMARLEKARKEDGLTLAQVVAASGGKLTDLQLLDMLNRSRMPMAKWDVLSSALAALGYPEAQDPAPPREKGGVSNG